MIMDRKIGSGDFERHYITILLLACAATAFMFGCLPERSAYEKYTRLKGSEAREACEEIISIGCPAVPLLIKALANEKPFPCSGVGVLKFESSAQPDEVPPPLSAARLYKLRNGKCMGVINSYQMQTARIGIKPSIVDCNMYLPFPEGPTVSSAANYLLSQILKHKFCRAKDIQTLQKSWQEYWQEYRKEHTGQEPMMSQALEQRIANAIKQLEYNGPEYDPCSQMYCRTLLEKGVPSITDILKLAADNRTFFGMYTIEGCIETVQNRQTAEEFLQSRDIAPEDYGTYMFELDSGEFLLLYTKLVLFEDIPGSSMITTYNDGIRGTSNLAAAHILLKMITGKSLEWKAGRDARKAMLKKWKKELKNR
jgi:hypothetical protein